MLPSSRQLTVQPGQPIDAAFLNAVQDAIVNVASGQTNAEEIDIGDGVGSGSPQLDISILITAVGIHQIGLPVKTGMRIREIRIVGEAAAGATMAVQYRTRKTGQAPTVEGSLSWTNETESRKVLDVTAIHAPDGLVVQNDVQHALYISVTGAGDAKLHKRTVLADSLPITNP